MPTASAAVLVNRERFINKLLDSELALRSMARVSNFPKKMCQEFEDCADRLLITINMTKARIAESV